MASIPWTTLDAVCTVEKGSINPQSTPAQRFAHYSIPAFDESGMPANELGVEIKSNKVRISNNAVLISKLNPRIPRVWRVNDELGLQRICSTEFVPLVANPKSLDRDYLFWSLNWLLTSGTIKGATQAATKSRERAKPADIAKQRIPLPDLPDQRRIVDVLARAEGLVRLHREAQSKTREIIPALFLDMFGDPATNPKRWAKAPLDRILEISSALKLPNAQTEASIVCIGPDSILEGAGEFLSKPTVADVLPRSGKYCYRRGQVLYSKIRPYLAKAAIAEEDGFCSADMYAFTATHGCEPEFLLRLLLSSAFTEFATQESVRARIPKVNRETLSGYEAINPPLALQTRFAEHVARIRGVQRQAESALAKAQAAFQALLYRAFAVDGSAGNR